MKKIDCFGDFCPLPLLKAQNEMDHMKPGDSFMLVTDHSCVQESMTDHYDPSRFHLEIEEVMNGVWEMTFTML